jgi:hypothetical protein
MDIAPLWWALAFGAGFGGNGTIIGSTANIIVVVSSLVTSIAPRSMPIAWIPSTLRSWDSSRAGLLVPWQSILRPEVLHRPRTV